MTTHRRLLLAGSFALALGALALPLLVLVDDGRPHDGQPAGDPGLVPGAALSTGLAREQPSRVAARPTPWDPPVDDAPLPPGHIAAARVAPPPPMNRPSETVTPPTTIERRGVDGDRPPRPVPGL